MSGHDNGKANSGRRGKEVDVCPSWDVSGALGSGQCEKSSSRTGGVRRRRNFIGFLHYGVDVSVQAR